MQRSLLEGRRHADEMQPSRSFSQDVYSVGRGRRLPVPQQSNDFAWTAAAMLAGANGSPYKHFCRNRKELLGLDRFQPRRAQGHCSNFQVYTIV